MKHLRTIFALALLAATPAAAQTLMDDLWIGGASRVVDGGTLEVVAGGTLNVSAGTLTMAAGQITLAAIDDSGALAALDTVATAQIDDGAVTLGKMADLATARILGRVTAETGAVEALTAAQVRTLLNVEDGAEANAVDSVFGRTGAVTATANDYTWAEIDKTVSDLADLATRSISATTGDLPWARVEAPGTAIFWIDNSPAQAWTDFELKGLSAPDTLEYYYHSPDPTDAALVQVYPSIPYVWFTDSGATPVRQWIRQNTTDSISAMLTDVNSYVGGWVVLVRGVSRANAESWTWSYALFDGATAEEDAAGRQIWRPVQPVRWTDEADWDPLATE